MRQCQKEFQKLIFYIYFYLFPSSSSASYRLLLSLFILLLFSKGFCFFIDRVGYSKRMPAIILAGDQCWPFFITLFLSCNWHIVFSDSLFSSNKLGVSIGY